MAWIKKSDFKGKYADYWGKHFISYEKAINKTNFILYLFWDKTLAYESPLVQLDYKKFIYDGDKTTAECYDLSGNDPFFYGAINDETSGFTYSDTLLYIQTGLTSLTVLTGKTYYSGQTAIIYYTNDMKMQGDVISYDDASGELNVNVRKCWGTTNKQLSDWYVYQVDTPINISVTGNLVGKTTQTGQINATNSFYGDNVISDCTFLSNNTNIATVSSSGLVSFVSTGYTTIKTTYKDISSGSTNVNISWIGDYLVITPNPISGTTGTTVQLSSKTNLGQDILEYTNWNWNVGQNIFTIDSGLLTIIGFGNGLLNATYFDMTGSTYITGYHNISSINILSGDVFITGLTTNQHMYPMNVVNQDMVSIGTECTYLSANSDIATCYGSTIIRIGYGTTNITITSIINPSVTNVFEITFVENGTNGTSGS